MAEEWENKSLRIALDALVEERCAPLVEALSAASEMSYGWHRLVRDALAAYHAAQGAGRGT